MAGAEKNVWTIGTILNWTKQYFGDKGVDNPRLDAEVLLSHVLGIDRLHLYVHFDRPLDLAELAAYREAVKRRAAREPVAYILGEREFMGLAFTVSPAVLVPRPDTEILAETALARLHTLAEPQVLDLCTGSGAVIISLLHQLPAAAGAAVDISEPALALARDNALRHGVADRLELLNGDLWQPVDGRRFDVITANPPYIPSGDLASLSPEVRREPRLALDGGRDGLDFYRRLAAGAAQHLQPGGMLAVEVGAGQAAAVAALSGPGITVETVIRDYAGIDRVVVFRRSEKE